MPWGVAISAAVGLYGANKQAKTAKNAANTQAASADQASQVQWDMFNQARQDQEPWRQAGLTGLNEYMALLGLPTSSVTSATTASTSPQTWFGDGGSRDNMAYYNDPNYRAAWDEVARFHNYDPNNAFTRKGEDRSKIAGHMQSIYNQKVQAAQPAAGTPGGTSLTQAQAFDRFRNTPGYQFGLSEGVRALDSSAAAAGGLFSGKAAKALTKFGTDYADQQGFRPYQNSLAELAGLGQVATNQIGSYGFDTARGVGNNLMSAGAARASGLTGSADAYSQLAGGLGGAFNNWYQGNKANNPGGTGWYFGNNPGRG